MSNDRAKSIYVCVFVNTPTNRAYEYDTAGNPVAWAVENLTPDEQRVLSTANDAANSIYAKYKFKVEIALCPLDYGQNAPIAYQNNIQPPGLLITAEYADGTRKQYPIGRDLDDKFLGVNWKPADVEKYYQALLLNRYGDGSECNLPLPILCSIGAWTWLILAGLSTYKAIEQKGNLRPIWAGAAAFAGYQFFQRGGFKSLKL